jgi:hypothetical protein
VAFEPGNDYFDLLPILAFATPAPDQEPPSEPGQIIINETAEYSVNISWEASTDNTSVAHYEIFIDGYPALITESLDTVADLEWLPCNTEVAIKIRAVDSYGNMSGFSPVKEAITQECTPHSIPGRIDSEKYSGKSSDINVFPNTDNGSGYHIGGFGHGGWTEYLVNVEEPGSYAADFRVFTGTSGGMIRLYSDDIEKGSLFIQGPINWTDRRMLVDLSEGEQIIRLDFSGPIGFLFDLNHIDIQPDQTGINGPGSETRIHVYPNPFDNNIYLESNADLADVRLYSLTGTLLNIQIKPTKTGLIINTSQLPAGIYFLSVSGITKKMIKF